MATILEFYILRETLNVLNSTVEKKGDKGLPVTLEIHDEVNKYNKNVKAYVSQNKEQREAKNEKYKVGYGKVVWDSGVKVLVPGKPAPAANELPKVAATPQQVADDDLPF